jgi:2-methylcitrate dehydratase PrpD
VTLEQALGTFAAEVVVPGDLRPAMRHRLLDTVAVGVCNARGSLIEALIDGAEAAGDSVVWGRRERLTAAGAAFANGALAHGSDYDDTQGDSGVHASAPVVAAAFAAAERAGTSTAALLDAVAVGVETSVRLGGAVGFRLATRGFHATPVVGVHGAAAASARALGLGPVEAANALALASSLASGLLQFLVGGGDVKPIHAGWSARAGYEAALWARSGVHGPTEAFEGRHGWFATFVGEDVDEAAVAASLGSQWRSTSVLPKRYPCCHFLQALVDAALELRAEVAPASLERAVALIPREGIDVVCEPEGAKRNPPDAYAAKFSAPYVLALALEDGGVTLDSFTDESLRRPQLASIVERVGYRVHDFSLAGPFSYPAGLTLHLTDGRTLTRLVERPAPLDDVALAKKVDDCAAAGGVDGARLRRLVEEEATVAELARALAGASLGVAA